LRKDPNARIMIFEDANKLAIYVKEQKGVCK